MSNLRKQYESLSYEELINFTDKIAEDLEQVKSHLAEANAHHKETGEYSDPDWYKRATNARRILGRKHQIAIQVLKQKRLQQRKSVDISRERRFIAIARSKGYITDNQWHEIWKQVDFEEIDKHGRIR